MAYMTTAQAIDWLRTEADYDPSEFKIRAIKDVRLFTGLGLKEAKDAVDGMDEMSLGDILDDLKARQQGTAPDARERKRARDRAYRARRRAELTQARNGNLGLDDDATWKLISAFTNTEIATEMRERLAAGGLTLHFTEVV